MDSWESLQEVLGDESFAKYLVCTFTHQNPYSDESKNMPDIYWLTQMMFIKAHARHDWKTFWEPQGELIASIIEPTVFKEYAQHKKALSKTEDLDEAKLQPVRLGTTAASTDSHYEPGKGLVDGNGFILIPDEIFKQKANIGGVAVSY